jgi:glycosyltransferase involved in cell wall biosynthesis
MSQFLIVSGDFVKTGGMDRANYALAAYLAARGDEVDLVAHRVAGDLEERPNVTFHRVPKPLGSYMLGGPMLRRAGLRRARQVAASGGRVVVNGGNCDWGDVNWVHHVHAADAARPAGSPLRKLKGRIDYRIHLAEERVAIRKARLVITGCERSRSDVIEKIGARPELVHAVYYGIDAAIFRPAGDDERTALRERLGWAAGRPKVAFVGALGDRRKGFDTLFAAWEALCKDSGWDADLIVVGRGAEVPAWKARAEEAGLAGRVEFLGFVRELPDLFRACDAHVLPSRYEGYSLVTQEATGCGVPAFITATAGIAERYPEGLRDLLIPDPEDVSDLVARLRRWRGRMAEDRAAVAAFSEQVRAQTWDRMSEQIVGLIKASG